MSPSCATTSLANLSHLPQSDQQAVGGRLFRKEDYYSALPLVSFLESTYILTLWIYVWIERYFCLVIVYRKVFSLPCITSSYIHNGVQVTDVLHANFCVCTRVFRHFSLANFLVFYPIGTQHYELLMSLCIGGTAYAVGCIKVGYSRPACRPLPPTTLVVPPLQKLPLVKPRNNIPCNG